MTTRPKGHYDVVKSISELYNTVQVVVVDEISSVDDVTAIRRMGQRASFLAGAAIGTSNLRVGRINSVQPIHCTS